MNYKLTTKDLPTFDGKIIKLHKFIPKKEIKGCIQIVHGSTEHGLRYKNLADFLCKNGYAVYALDLRAHGLSCKDPSELGIVSWNKCTDQVLTDISNVFVEMYKDYPECERKFMIGHSYGSFLAQRFLEVKSLDKNLKGVVLSGTSGPQSFKMFMGRILVSLIMLFTGKNKRSEFVRNLMWGSYNKKFNPDNPKGHDWLSRDPKTVEEYVSDPLCGFAPPNCFAYSLMDLMYMTFLKKNLKEINKNMQLLYIWGTDDPVGNYGKNPRITTDILSANGNNITTIEYHDGRHEMFNEINKNEVYADLLNWMEKIQ